MNKIDSYKPEKEYSTSTNMKPIYSTNEELMCGIIEYNNKTYMVDLSDKDRIINFNKMFVFTKEDDVYPSYAYNYKRFTYLDFIYSFNQESVYYIFKNGNQFDLRRKNVEIYHFYHKNIVEQYNVVEYINGHYLTMGQDANIMKNPIWRIKENDKEYLLMYCEKNTICKLCAESYQKIMDYEVNINNGKKICWFKLQNGYIMGSVDLYIHQIITGCHGNGKGTKNISVDHIDQDPLNNAWDNLRIATRKEQEQNSKGIKSGTKRERKSSAKSLPEGIAQEMLKKYVVYYQEWLNTEHTKQREFFKVEKHPKLDKIWIGTKSNKISIQEKLAQANKVVDDLEKDVYPETHYPALPKYVSLITMREKPHLVFEKRIDGKRLNIKMVLPEEYDLHNQLAILDKKIIKKYNSCKESLNIFKYTYEVKLDDYLKYIKYITFDISRWGKYKETLNFEEPVTEQTAVLEVEKWLTNKATEEYFDKIKDNCYLKELSEYGPEPTRGRLLGDRRFLETLEKNGYESVFIECGS